MRACVITDHKRNRTELERLLRQVGGLIAALTLIVIVSHFIGGAAGRWAELEWELNAGH
jgi:hypothetical protein